MLSDAKRKRKRPEDLLLDISVHHHAMRGLKNYKRRGRPDIVYLSLLTALDSPLNKAGMLRTFIHTIDRKLIEISSQTRLPRSFSRFEGLMAQLLNEGHIPRERPFLAKVLSENLRELIEKLDLKVLIGLSREGREVKFKDLVEKLISKNEKVGFFVGGFQRGFFSTEVSREINDLVRISNYHLSSHIAICRALKIFEDALGVF